MTMANQYRPDANFGAYFLDDFITWVSGNLEPYDVFPEKQLDAWAFDNDFVRLDEVEDEARKLGMEYPE